MNRCVYMWRSKGNHGTLILCAYSLSNTSIFPITMFLLIYKLLWTCWKWQAINMQRGRYHRKVTMLKACSQLTQRLLDCLFIQSINMPDCGAQVGYFKYKMWIWILCLEYSILLYWLCGWIHGCDAVNISRFVRFASWLCIWEGK